MRVNSAFTGFFTCRLTVKARIVMALLAIFVSRLSYAEHSDRDLRAKQVNLLIRQTGHQLLLQAGDSSSRVLPVSEIREGTFLLRFENEFVFNHDSLMALSRRFLPKKEFSSGYTVTVHDCMKGDIVYGFQVNNTSPDILACTGRKQPAGCYTIEFAFPDLYKHIKQEKSGTDRLTESVETDTGEVNAKLAEMKTRTSGSDRSPQTDELKPDTGEASSTLSEATTLGYPSINLVYAGILVLLGGILLIGRFGKFLKPTAPQDYDRDKIQASVPELAALGKFLFDVKDQRLHWETEVVNLTDKECKVLKLLHQHFGELIPRETLMQEIWINDGVITGRSLDMFVSKLRKKLSRDPELKITNVHGKGYKLEIPDRELVNGI